ncbi:MAG: serine/threonine protein kinase [Clostridia bacterium]|nr:serine/threonine protein kinase [Clostridia bacterium]
MIFLEDILKEQYFIVKVLKNTEEKSIVLLRHKVLEKDMICRKFKGNAEAYKILNGIIFPTLPQIYEVTKAEGKIIVLEEFIKGVTVADILSNGLFNERGVKKIIRDLCDALTVIHSYGIIHRDIKPENIMITDEGSVKLIDFDAARLFKNGQSKDTKIIGTTGYAAPEQFGLAQSDERTDIFAVGVLMNVMLTGEHPSQKIYKGKLSKTIEKCIQIDPKKRYRSAEELKKTL